MGLSLTDADFAAIVTKPDNVAIVAMMFLLGDFTWLARVQSGAERRASGSGGRTAGGAGRRDRARLARPGVHRTDLHGGAEPLLIFWGLGLQAPLEAPASSVKTPNPSKGVDFVGLQETLYYFDPWMAGVVLPGLIIFGLMAIPYLDGNSRKEMVTTRLTNADLPT